MLSTEPTRHEHATSDATTAPSHTKIITHHPRSTDFPSLLLIPPLRVPRQICKDNTHVHITEIQPSTRLSNNIIAPTRSMLGGANPSHNTRDPNRPKPTKNALVEQHRSPTSLGVPPPTCLARPIRRTTHTSPINRSRPKHIHVEQLHDNALQRCPPCVMVTM